MIKRLYSGVGAQNLDPRKENCNPVPLGIQLSGESGGAEPLAGTLTAVSEGPSEGAQGSKRFTSMFSPTQTGVLCLGSRLI